MKSAGALILTTLLALAFGLAVEFGVARMAMDRVQAIFTTSGLPSR